MINISEEEKKVIENLKEELKKPLETQENICDTFILVNIKDAKILLNLIEKLEKVIDKVKDYCNNDLSFERILKRDNRTPDLFNQGRFYACQNIKDIIDGKVENNDKS